MTHLYVILNDAKNLVLTMTLLSQAHYHQGHATLASLLCMNNKTKPLVWRTALSEVLFVSEVFRIFLHEAFSHDGNDTVASGDGGGFIVDDAFLRP